MNTQNQNTTAENTQTPKNPSPRVMFLEYDRWKEGQHTISAIVKMPGEKHTVNVSGYCNSAFANTIVNVINSGTASFTYDYDPCKNKCVLFTDNSTNALTWYLDYGDGQNSYSQTNSCHYYNGDANYNASLIINNSTNCVDTFSLLIPYEDHDTVASVYIPNAFSPNNDGDNDQLKFYLLDEYCVKEFEIVIYDRWGEQVFKTIDINSTWEGTFNGEKLHSKVFSYYCKTVTTTGKQIIRKGNISVL